MYHHTIICLNRIKNSPSSPSGNTMSPNRKSTLSRSRNTAGQFAQEEKTLSNDLKVVVDDVKLGHVEVVATDYNALLSAKDCLLHLKEHAGQSLSMWKNSLSGSATD